MHFKFQYIIEYVRDLRVHRITHFTIKLLSTNSAVHYFGCQGFNFTTFLLTRCDPFRLITRFSLTRIISKLWFRLSYYTVPVQLITNIQQFRDFSCTPHTHRAQWLKEHPIQRNWWHSDLYCALLTKKWRFVGRMLSKRRGIAWANIQNNVFSYLKRHAIDKAITSEYRQIFNYHASFCVSKRAITFECSWWKMLLSISTSLCSFLK